MTWAVVSALGIGFVLGAMVFAVLMLRHEAGWRAYVRDLKEEEDA